jgi:hypothetical protein
MLINEVSYILMHIVFPCVERLPVTVATTVKAAFIGFLIRFVYERERERECALLVQNAH